MTESNNLMKSYGWRGRIGLLVPSVNFAMEHEFSTLAPSGVSICTGRLKVRDDLHSAQEIVRLGEEELEKAAKEVVDAKVDLIVFGCTSGSCIKGLGYDKEIVKKIEDLTGIQAITASTSVIEALKELKIENVALVTPYNDEVSSIVANFISDNEFNIANLVGGTIQPSQMVSSAAYERAIIADTPKADGIFISCTSFQTICIIEKLEKDLNKPVASSNIASMWYALKKLKIKDAICGYGTLLEKPR